MLLDGHMSSSRWNEKHLKVAFVMVAAAEGGAAAAAAKAEEQEEEEEQEEAGEGRRDKTESSQFRQLPALSVCSGGLLRRL